MVGGEAWEACFEVLRVLKHLKVDHYVGGSLASSFHGEPRSTNDVDLVADLETAHVPGFVAALRDTFYVSLERVQHAVERRSSFNVIFLRTMFKVDIFVTKDDDFAKEEMRRRQRVVISPDLEPIDVASAEDTILQKLAWYRLGGGVSDRQWGDLLGVLKVRGEELDREYLTRWSEHMEVADLLERALVENSQISG